MAKEMFVIVRSHFSAIHCWPMCPFEEVSFLKHPHRHIFHVEVKCRIDHEDRNLEFFMVKNRLNIILTELFEGRDLGSLSCEMMAQAITKNLDKALCKMTSIPFNSEKPFYVKSVSVFEDGENGAEVVYAD